MKKLIDRINSISAQIAGVAQGVYDDWEQDSEGFCEEHGYGGICDAIADAIGGWISSTMSGVEIVNGGQDGDDHAFIVVLTKKEAVLVDIPPYVYETGGGYCWKKKRGVVFTAGDVVAMNVDRKLF